ncbi:unnamed protein product [Rhizoctonia solani]|uniref:Altered inheritance of mitochondria protein 9, mitochondrial n=1 Tax=Rhizoctonia solani TaxID=456999 RepID=A0A8H2WEC6_9AGAM|nr:unnamed protein product [Rhizoctonia solani]
MDYVRTILKVPVPEVLAYSARAHSTPVGTEFILMRPSSGNELRKRWDSMSEVDAKAVIDHVLHAETQFANYHFAQIGSIYYVEDVEPALRKLPLYRDGSYFQEGADRFRIGPSTEWALWRGARAELKVDRGPWPDVRSYIEGVVRIHQAWLSNYAQQHRVQVPPRSLEDLDPKTHEQLLDKLASSQVQVPRDLCTNVLWHKDLHARNIMVNNSSPLSIELIDWQSVSVGPIFQQATFAIFAQYHGDSRINLCNNAQLPDDFDSLPWHEKIYLRHQRQLALRHLYYSSRIEYRSLSAQQWAHDTHLRSAIDESSRTWDSGSRLLHDGDTDWTQAYQDKVTRLYKELGVEGDGWVPTEHYDDVYILNQERMQSWDEVAADGPYPIVDGAPSWFRPDQIKLTMLAAEKHRESHRRQGNKTQQREQLAYFALDTFIRKWHDWAYDLDRHTNIRWDDRRDELNESNFNAAYDQIQRYELDSEANLVNFAFAVAANAPVLSGPTLPIGLGGIGGSPLLTPPRKVPVSLPAAR